MVEIVVVLMQTMSGAIPDVTLVWNVFVNVELDQVILYLSGFCRLFRINEL